jgi:hypothetical protein
VATLGDVAKLVRSKNAGPFWLTIDIMFDDVEAYRRALDADIVNRAAIARLYNRNLAEIIVVNHDAALAIKVSFTRVISYPCGRCTEPGSISSSNRQIAFTASRLVRSALPPTL